MATPLLGDTATRKAETIKIARLARRVLQGAALALALLFTWLKFHGLNFVPLLNDVNAQLLLRATLAAYYMSWVFGAKSDTDDQELLYIEPPDRQRVIRASVVTLLLIAVPFGVLCYVRSYRAFAVVLSIFLACNVITWRLLVSYILRRPVDETRSYYLSQKAYSRLFELRLFFDEYLCGSWQVLRFLTGAVMVGVIDVFAFTDIYARIPFSGPLRNKDFAGAALVFVFVFVFETWIWARRLQFRAGYSVVEELAASYKFEPVKMSGY
jgi:hypothetical protein